MLLYKNLLPSGEAVKKKITSTDEYEGESDEDTISAQLSSLKSVQKDNRKNITPECDPERPGRTLSQLVVEAKARADPLTKLILKESTNFSAKIRSEPPWVNVEGYVLSKLPSLPNAYGSDARTSASDTLGLGTMNFSPMKLCRIYGRTGSLPVFNLTGMHKSHVVYAASNVVVAFDYYENRQSVLQGHKNKITCLAKDNGCKYFASADVGNDSSIIIWDISTGLPYKTFRASRSGLGVISIGFLGTHELIGTIGLEQFLEPQELEPEAPESDKDDLGEDHCSGMFHDAEIEEKKKVAEEEQKKAKELEKEESSKIKNYKQMQIVSIWKFGQHHRNQGERKAGGHSEVMVIIPEKVGFQHEIVFDDDIPNYFVTTGHSHVVFYTWIKASQKINIHLPRTPKKFVDHMKGFTTSIWMKTSKGNLCLTGTGAGFVVVWATLVPLGLQEIPDPTLNLKQYKRSYRIGDRAITALTALGEYFVVGDNTGIVKFFDRKFRIVRWTKDWDLPPITSIGFNYGDTIPSFKEEMQGNYDDKQKPHAHREKISAVREYTFGGEKYRLPSQTTIQRPQFYAPDFVIGCEDGSIYYYHLAEGRVDPLIYGTPGPIVAIDCCPKTSHVAMCTLHGQLQMYDYVNQNLIYNGKFLPKKKEKEQVNCLKFHPSGSHAFIGMRSGLIFLRHSYTWKAMEPLDNSNGVIERIVFSDDGVYMSHWDATNAVALYAFPAHRGYWVFKGHHRSHYRPIVDLAFFFDETNKMNRLFSLAQDRFLIEYNIADSNTTEGLMIQNIFFAEQTSIPTAMTFDTPFRGMDTMILHANTDNKIKVYDQYANKFRRCCQGPSFGAPVNRMIPITPDQIDGQRTKFILIVMGNKIGLMKTPVDGNPFKSMAVLAHPEGVREVTVTFNNKEVFTCGFQDNCSFMWAPHIEVVEHCVLTGGAGIGPYRQLLDARLPPEKSIFEDVENIFYHMLLRSALTPHEMLKMNLDIPISEISTVMRTCGFFPSEQEIDEMMEEAEFLGELNTREKPTTIGFDDFIKLFANHVPIPNNPPEDVHKAFEVLGELNNNDELFIEKETFENYVTKFGEKITADDLPNFVPQLYHVKVQTELIKEDKVFKPWLQYMTPTEQNKPDEPEENLDQEGDQETLASLSESPPHMSLSRRTTVAELNILKKKSHISGNDEEDENKFMTVRSEESFSSKDSIDLESPRKTSSETDSANESADSDYFGFEAANDESAGEDGQPRVEMELLEEIYANYFIHHILPGESQDTIGQDIQKESEEHMLGEMYAENECKIWDEIMQRWQGRDQWRYFKCVFEKLTEKNYPLGRKLRLAIQMDYFCRTGKWPNLRVKEEDEEEEAEKETETQEVEAVKLLEEIYYKSPPKMSVAEIPETMEIKASTIEQVQSLHDDHIKESSQDQEELEFEEFESPAEEEDEGEGQEDQLKLDQDNELKEFDVKLSYHSAGSDDDLTMTRKEKPDEKPKTEKSEEDKAGKQSSPEKLDPESGDADLPPPKTESNVETEAKDENEEPPKPVDEDESTVTLE